MKAKFVIFFMALVLGIGIVNAASLGVSPGVIKFENVLRGGYAERSVTISTDSTEELEVVYEVEGSIAEIIRFEPELSNPRISQSNKLRLNVIAEPPDDLPSDFYEGKITFLLIQPSDIKGRAGGTIIPGIAAKIEMNLVGDEIIKCRAGGISISDIEVGENPLISFLLTNDGNTRLRPLITMDVWDQTQQNLLVSKEVQGDQVLPTTQQEMQVSIPFSELSTGQYWTKISIPDCQASELQTFDILEPGEIDDRGDFRGFQHKNIVQKGETTPIKAIFVNTGERSVIAKFIGTISLDGRVIETVRTDELTVSPKSEITFEFFFTPEEDGQYIINGRVQFNKKLSFEKESTLQVISDEFSTGFGYLPLLIYLLIIITIIFLVRKIRKEKKKY